MYSGMKARWFTGQKLSDFFSAALSDPYNTRRIINGLDRAADSAVVDRAFLAALKSAESEAPVPAAEPTPSPPDIEPALVPAAQPATSGGVFFALADLLKRIFA
jgi:hypothetical protein